LKEEKKGKKRGKKAHWAIWWAFLVLEGGKRRQNEMYIWVHSG
jgi:hypothetical protein